MGSSFHIHTDLSNILTEINKALAGSFTFLLPNFNVVSRFDTQNDTERGRKNLQAGNPFPFLTSDRGRRRKEMWKREKKTSERNKSLALPYIARDGTRLAFLQSAIFPRDFTIIDKGDPAADKM